MHVAPTALRLGSGSGDPISVHGSDGQRSFQELGRGTGMKDIDLEMMFELKLIVGDLDLSRWELTDRLGDYCHCCRSPWRQGYPYSSYGSNRLLLASSGKFEHWHC